MQLKLAKRTVDGILALECNGRIVFGEESSLLRDEVKKAIGNAGGIAHHGAQCRGHDQAGELD